MRVSVIGVVVQAPPNLGGRRLPRESFGEGVLHPPRQGRSIDGPRGPPCGRCPVHREGPDLRAGGLLEVGASKAALGCLVGLSGCLPGAHGRPLGPPGPPLVFLSVSRGILVAPGAFPRAPSGLLGDPGSPSVPPGTSWVPPGWLLGTPGCHLGISQRLLGCSHGLPDGAWLASRWLMGDRGCFTGA